LSVNCEGVGVWISGEWSSIGKQLHQRGLVYSLKAL
jgi:hypothetical protein